MSLSAQNSVGTVETICCTRAMEKVTVSHMFKIMGSSLDLDISKGKNIESTIFSVGGYEWAIQYYPNGSTKAKDDYISIFLYLKSKLECNKAQVCFTILDQSGCALTLSQTTQIRIFKGKNDNWGYTSFCKRAKLESNIKDDCFVIKSVVTVFKVFLVEPTAQVVPPGTIQQQHGHLLENKNGADVTFEVDGQTISAHKCILAARSPVFSAQLFGPMKEKSVTIIKIEEMEVPVFKAMLHFIYNDTCPGLLEEKKESDKKQDSKIMAQHLLVAADRYGLERLKIICENILCGSIDTSNVITLLSLAERHICHQLKTSCLKFLAYPETLGGVVEMEEFQYLVRNRPLILKELLQSKLVENN